MGYKRNYHAYMFTDSRDGAQFGISGRGHPARHGGPIGMDGPIDLMHMRERGYEMIDDRTVRLSQLVSKVGDNLVYVSYSRFRA